MRILRQVWRSLVRMDVVSILIFLVLLVAAIGSCLPQRSSTLEADPLRLALWQAKATERYGLFTTLLDAIGAFNLFRSPSFLMTIVILTTSTLICTLDRWKGIWRRVFSSKVRCADATFETALHRAKITKVGNAALFNILDERLSERGFRVRTEAASESFYLRGDRNRMALLGTLASHIGVVLLIFGLLMSAVFGWREEISVNGDHPSTISHMPYITLRHEGFTIDRYPDGSAADYKANILLADEEGPTLHRSVSVNKPITYRGIQVFLMGYKESLGEVTLSILTVHDPGYGPIITAGFLLLIGMTISFNFPHCCIQARIDPDGTLFLAGQAERRAYDFGREFESLVKELETVVLQ